MDLKFIVLASVFCATVVQSDEILRNSNGLIIFEPTVNLTYSAEVTDRYFVSVAVGTRTLIRTIGSSAQFNMESARFYTLAKSLSPLVMRLGGVFSSFFIFSPSKEEVPENYDGLVPDAVQQEWMDDIGADQFWDGCVPGDAYCNTVYTAYHLKRLADYLSGVDWQLMLDINHQLRLNNVWDETNLLLLCDYLEQDKIQLAAIQLGNEAILYESKLGRAGITPEVMAQDYIKFRQVLDSHPYCQNIPIHGPDGTSIARSYGAQVWIKAYFAAGGGPPLGACGLHHYYVDGKNCTDEDFMDPTKMDQFQILTDMMKAIKAEHNLPDLPVHMTETANAYGGGSDQHSHHFIGTFLYLDELGMCAKGGVKRVHRQSFNSAAYSLINQETMSPFPDYYIAVTHKRLVLGPVLDVYLRPVNANLRIFGHCARMDYYDYPKGAAVIYYSNLFDEHVELRLGNTFEAKPDMDLYIFETGEEGNLHSIHMKLNGVLLDMVKDSALPDILPVQRTSTTVTLPPHSLGFIVVKNANSEVCLNRPDDEIDTGGGIINMNIKGACGYAYSKGPNRNGYGGVEHNLWNRLRSNSLS